MSEVDELDNDDSSRSPVHLSHHDDDSSPSGQHQHSSSRKKLKRARIEDDGPPLREIAVGTRYPTMNHFQLDLHKTTLPDGVKYTAPTRMFEATTYKCNWFMTDTSANDNEHQDECTAFVTTTSRTSSDAVVVTQSKMARKDHSHSLDDAEIKRTRRKHCEKGIWYHQRQIRQRADEQHARGGQIASGETSDTGSPAPLIRIAPALESLLKCTPYDKGFIYEPTASDVANVPRNANAAEYDVDRLIQNLGKGLLRPDDPSLEFTSARDLAIYMYAWAKQNYFTLYSFNTKTSLSLHCIGNHHGAAKRLKIEKCGAYMTMGRNRRGKFATVAANWNHSHKLDKQFQWAIIDKNFRGNLEPASGQAFASQAQSNRNSLDQDAADPAKPPAQEDTAAVQKVTHKAPAKTESPAPILTPNHNFDATLSQLLGTHRSSLAQFAPMLIRQGVESIQAFTDLVLMTRQQQEDFLRKVISNNEKDKVHAITPKMTLFDRQSLLTTFSKFAVKQE
ncbi:hypothetical protein OIO90_000009 [Microbotryomycetes sp. JL221]|nr:hypothetical protein OIO90_000009 [Microbotryomycetes sp. JL221]